MDISKLLLIFVPRKLNKTFRTMENRKETFNCVTLSRADFEDRGFDTSNISDERMERIASRIGDTLVENLYWECIDVWGESEKMPKLKD